MRSILSPTDGSLPSPLAAALGDIADASWIFAAPWWIIGSAAARLVGAEVRDIADVDLLISPEDAGRLDALWSARPRAAAPDPSGQFRSAHFRRYLGAPLPIEAVAGFELRDAGAWEAVSLTTRLAVGRVFVPSRAEQIALLERMNRTKDRPRIAALKALKD